MNTNNERQMNTLEKKQRADEMFGKLNNQHDQPVGVLIGTTREQWGHCLSGSTRQENWTGRPLRWDSNHVERGGRAVTHAPAATTVEIYGTDEDGKQSKIGELEIVTETETCKTYTGETYKQTHATVYLDRTHFLDALLTDARGAKPGWCVVHRDEERTGLPGEDASIVWETHQPNLIEATLDAYCALVG